MSDRDRFGRLLRYVWLDFEDGEVYLVNEALVRAGYAAFSTFPPDVKYVEEMREAGQFAREYGYGLWSGCITDDEGDTNELSGTQGINAESGAGPCPDEAGAAPEQGAIADPASAFGCEPSYPDVCIPPSPPDLDCGDVAYRRFTVYSPDPHRFDGDLTASAAKDDEGDARSSGRCTMTETPPSGMFSLCPRGQHEPSPLPTMTSDVSGWV